MCLCSLFLLLMFSVIMSIMNGEEDDLTDNPVLGCCTVIWLASGLCFVVSAFWLLTDFL
jgi:hypothetical protein